MTAVSDDRITSSALAADHLEHVPAHRVSVIVPAFQASRTLAASLRSIRASVPEDAEIVVVDDGSFDDTLAIAGELADVVVGRPCQGGAARARNDGARVASGDVLLFVDADVTVNRAAVEGVLANLGEGADAVFGAYEPLPPPEVRNFATTYKNVLHHYTHSQSPGPADTFWSGFGAVRRDAFVAVGGFDPAVTTGADVEDIHLGYRLRAAGYHIVLDPTLQVIHHKRYTVGEVIRSDVLHRAVPWTRAMLAMRSFHSDLNLRRQSMASAVITIGIPATALASLRVGVAGVLSAGVLTVAWIVVHWRLLSYFRRAWSTAGALGSAGMLALYYVYGIVGAALGAAAHLVRHERKAQLNWLRFDHDPPSSDRVAVTLAVVARPGECFAALDALPEPAPWWELFVVAAEPPDVLPPGAVFVPVSRLATRDQMRQLALERAKGEMFATLDASTVPDPGWLDCVRQTASTAFLAVAGPFHHDRRSVRDRAAQVVRFWLWRPEAGRVWMTGHPSNNAAFRTSVARRLGGFQIEGALILRLAGFGARPVRLEPAMSARLAGSRSVTPFLRGVGGTARLRSSATVRYLDIGRLHRVVLVLLSPVNMVFHLFRIVRDSVVERTADVRLWAGLPLIALGITAHWAGRNLGLLRPEKRGGLVPRSEDDLALLLIEFAPVDGAPTVARET